MSKNINNNLEDKSLEDSIDDDKYCKIKEFTPQEKRELLSRNIWRKSECCRYIGFQAPALSNFFKKMEKPPFHSCVYRDEFLKFIKTNVKDEIEIMKNYVQKEDDK